MSQFSSDLKSVRTDLKIILFLCVCGILLHDLWLKNVQELVFFGSEMGNILYGIAASYIASFIFYFLVVHSEKEKDKRMFSPYIQVHIRNMLANTDSLLREIVRADNPGIEVNPETLKTSEARALFSKIDPRSNAPCVNMTGVRVHWMQYINLCRRHDLENIRRILDKGPLIETELNRILSNIEVCRYFYTIAFYENMLFSNSSLAGWGEAFEEYVMFVDELRKYARSHIFSLVDV